ncbi:hypothetical protein WJX74_004090 [Apatococcus lobatus]|uniref:Transmembrane protein n=1 Tax=Apatococcus lobatus TaxID=904363 RepID=A0AAW1QNC5_9CHLO
MPPSEGLQRLQRLAASQNERRSLPVTAPSRSEGHRQRKGSTIERGSFKYVLFLVAGGLIVAGFYIAPDFTARPLHLRPDRTLTGEKVGNVLLEEPDRLRVQNCVGDACRIIEVSTHKPEGGTMVQQKQVGLGGAGERVLIQEDATGQATVHQVDPQGSPPLDYRGVAADALTGSDATGGSSTGSENQAMGAGTTSASKGAGTKGAAAGSHEATTGEGVITVADDLVAKAQKSPILDIGTKDGILDNQAAHAHHEGDNMMDFTKAANETGNSTAVSWSARAVNANLTQGGMFPSRAEPPIHHYHIPATPAHFAPTAAAAAAAGNGYSSQVTRAQHRASQPAHWKRSRGGITGVVGGNPPPSPLVALGKASSLQQAAGSEPPPSPLQGDPGVMKSTSALLRQSVQAASQSPPTTPSPPVATAASEAVKTLQQPQRLQSDAADMVLPGGIRVTPDATAAGLQDSTTGAQTTQAAYSGGEQQKEQEASLGTFAVWPLIIRNCRPCLSHFRSSPFIEMLLKSLQHLTGPDSFHIFAHKFLRQGGRRDLPRT